MCCVTFYKILIGWLCKDKYKCYITCASKRLWRHETPLNQTMKSGLVSFPPSSPFTSNRRKKLSFWEASNRKLKSFFEYMHSYMLWLFCIDLWRSIEWLHETNRYTSTYIYNIYKRAMMLFHVADNNIILWFLPVWRMQKHKSWREATHS